MKTKLNLTIKQKWFDMIARGEKKEEYRDCENRQVQRAYLAACNNRWWEEEKPVIVFRNGYTMKSRALVAEIKGYDLRGRCGVRHPEWGEPSCRRLHIVVMLGTILYKGSYAEVKRWVMQSQKMRQ